MELSDIDTILESARARYAKRANTPWFALQVFDELSKLVKHFAHELHWARLNTEIDNRMKEDQEDVG